MPALSVASASVVNTLYNSTGSCNLLGLTNASPEARAGLPHGGLRVADGWSGGGSTLAGNTSPD